MVIDNLVDLPIEDDLTDIIYQIFNEHPHVFNTFLNQYTQINDVECSAWKPEVRRKNSSGIPDMVFVNDKYIIIFEDKMCAGLSEGQLSRYIEYGKSTGKNGRYFFIAPPTSRYKHGNIPSEYIKITWDNIYDFFHENLSIISLKHQNKIENILERYRWTNYSLLFDRLYKQISKMITFNSKCYALKDKYHTDHVVFQGTPGLEFSIGHYLDAPSYIKLNPWNVTLKGKTYKIISTMPAIKTFREKIEGMAKTRHELESNAPGYVIDMKLSAENTEMVICTEIVDLMSHECQNIINIYNEMVKNM